MSIAPDLVQRWLDTEEDEHLECKEARNRYDFDLLAKYCAALANERGGHIVLGVTDRVPRRAEVVFEYRSSDASGPAAQRLDLREGYLLFHDRLWEAINLRNDRQSFQNGLTTREIPQLIAGRTMENFRKPVNRSSL